MPEPNSTETQALDPSELQEAVALAFLMYQQDTERSSAVKATEEMEVPPKYLALAMSAMLREKEQAAARSQGWKASARNIGVGVLVAAILVVVGVTVWPNLPFWSAPADALIHTPRYSPLPKTVTVTALPILGAPYRAMRSSGQTLETKITFQSKVDASVSIYKVDFYGWTHFVANLGPREEATYSGYTSAPYLVFDAAGKPLGMYFAQFQPMTTAIVSGAATMPTAQTQLGYRQPASVGSTLPPLKDFKETGESDSVTFVNVTDRSVSLYSLGMSKKPVWITTIPPHDMYFSDMFDHGALCIVGDDSGNTLETFVMSGISDVAVITPDVLR